MMNWEDNWNSLVRSFIYNKTQHIFNFTFLWFSGPFPILLQVTAQHFLTFYELLYGSSCLFFSLFWFSLVSFLWPSLLRQEDLDFVFFKNACGQFKRDFAHSLFVILLPFRLHLLIRLFPDQWEKLCFPFSPNTPLRPFIKNIFFMRFPIFRFDPWIIQRKWDCPYCVSNFSLLDLIVLFLKGGGLCRSHGLYQA